MVLWSVCVSRRLLRSLMRRKVCVEMFSVVFGNISFVGVDYYVVELYGCVVKYLI